MVRRTIIPILLLALLLATCRSFSTPRPRRPSVACNAKARRLATEPTSTRATLKDFPTEDLPGHEAAEKCGSPRQPMRSGNDIHRCSRRTLLFAILSSTAALSNVATHPALAAASGEDDEFIAPMNGLAKRIRKSVVRGAQLIDKADGRWEQFSDSFGLGSERNRPRWDGIDAGGNQRSKKVVRSEATVDPKDLVLDELFASGLLKECDEAFLACLKTQQPQTSTTKQELDQRIDETRQLLRKSFFSSPATPTPIDDFNFECYVHFRVFNEILVNRKVIFPPFRKEFESVIGNRLIGLALQQQSSVLSDAPASNLAKSLQNALGTTDAIATLLQKRGFVTSWERSVPPEDDVEDFTTYATSSDGFSFSSDLPYSLALNGDVTLNSQLLLQELGYRLYPSFGRWLVGEGISRCFAGPSLGGADGGRERRDEVAVQIDDYYMDTGYSSNPDLFEVKQVLLNIAIQRD